MSEAIEILQSAMETTLQKTADSGYSLSEEEIESALDRELKEDKFPFDTAIMARSYLLKEREVAKDALRELIRADFDHTLFDTIGEAMEYWSTMRAVCEAGLVVLEKES